MIDQQHATTLSRLERLFAIIMQTEQSLEDLHSVQSDLRSQGTRYAVELFQSQRLNELLQLASYEAQGILGAILLLGVQNKCKEQMKKMSRDNKSSMPGVTPDK